MNATEQSLNKPSTSILSDSSISTTTVELGNLELNLESFSAIAKKLIEAGWDGDEDELEMSGTKKNPQYKYQDYMFPQNDLDNIKSIVFRQLGKTSETVTSSTVSSPYHISSALKSSSSILTQSRSELSIPENTYEHALERLRTHLHGLQNVYLAKDIGDKLQNIRDINWSIESKFIEEIVNSSWPFETRELFVNYLHLFRAKGLKSDLNTVNQTIQKMKEDLQQVIVELQKQTEANMRQYMGWKEFQSLFEIPTFAALSDTHFKKILLYIDKKAPEDLRDFVESLDSTQTIDKRAAETYLSGIKYKYDLDTLLGEVIDKRPSKSEGIVTYWNQPKEFFVGKMLSLCAPNGTMQNGCIIHCERKADGGLEFELDDCSQVWIQAQTFQTTIIRCYSSHYLIRAIQANSLQKGDIFWIRHHPESHLGMIKPGKYKLRELSEHTALAGSEHRSNPYSEYLFADPDSNQDQYRIRAESYGGQMIQIHIGQWDASVNDYIGKPSMSLYEFERSHLADKRMSIGVDEINAANVDTCILITSELDEERARIKHLEQIKIDLINLRQKFQSQENEALMDLLLTNLIENKMKVIDLNLLNENHPDLVKSLRELSRKYVDTLQITRTPEQIFLETVLDANYVKLVSMQGSVLIARTMNLLKEAKEHINQIVGRDIVLFMGSTGSGKSTTIAYLMEAPLKKKQNHIGDNVLHIQQSENKYPKIGQSIGTSETLYTQGYSIPDQSFLLGDCPGFNDTRGGDYDLCANFSIDQAVLKSKTLLSLVIVLPVSAFLMDRGNSVIDMISHVKERFPSILDPKNPQKNARVHLLLTKQGQLKAEVVAHMKDGSRFEEFVKETTKQIDTLVRQGSSFDSPEVQSIRRRQEIWQVILHMHQHRQVQFIDTRNQKARTELLETYSSSANPLDKQQYLPAMLNDHARNKFGNSVQLAAHAWLHLILGKYLKTLPEEIETSLEWLEQRKNSMNEYKKEKENRLLQAWSLEENVQQLTTLIQRLEKNEENVMDDKLKEELLAEISASENHLVEQERTALKNVEKMIEHKRENLSQIELQVKKCEDEISEYRKKIEGIVYEVQYVRDDSPSHLERSPSVRSSNVLSDLVFSLPELLFSPVTTILSVVGITFTRTVRVVKGPVLASIINMITTDALKRELQNCILYRDSLRLGVKESALSITQEIDELETIKNRHEQTIKDLLNSQALHQVKEMLAQTKMRLQAVESEKRLLNDCSVLNKKIVDLEQEIVALDQKIAKLHKNHRNLAIIIKTQWDSAKLLREFSDQICDYSSSGSDTDRINQGQHLNATMQTCKQFIDLFDQHKDTLLQKIKEDYGF